MGIQRSRPQFGTIWKGHRRGISSLLLLCHQVAQSCRSWSLHRCCSKRTLPLPPRPPARGVQSPASVSQNLTWVGGPGTQTECGILAVGHRWAGCQRLHLGGWWRGDSPTASGGHQGKGMCWLVPQLGSWTGGGHRKYRGWDQMPVWGRCSRRRTCTHSMCVTGVTAA